MPSIKKKWLILVGILSIIGNTVAASLNPTDFGVLNCKTGVERFRILAKCHAEALRMGCPVSYRGIDSLFIEIPTDGNTIMLSQYTDFCNVKICVRNNVNDIPLFKLSDAQADVNIAPSLLRKGSLIKKIVDKNLCLISVTDSNPWVIERLGFGHPVYRSDILVVKKGLVSNDPIFSYDSKASQPTTTLIACSTDKKFIGNILFYRDEKSTYKTFLFRVENSYNVTIDNVMVHTPYNDKLIGDAVIGICNSAKVFLSNITIPNTYSRNDSYGYGITLNNVYDLNVDKLKGHPKWGLFYASNLQKATLKNCEINRFDTHCYGRDYKIVDCMFKGLTNPLSSVYGSVSFIRCFFDDADPVGLRQDYNANTPFDISFEKCIFNMTEKHNCILRMNGLSEAENEREELKGKNLPNIYMRDCEINFASDVYRWFLIITGKNAYSSPIKYLSRIDIDGLTIDKEMKFDVSSSIIQTQDTLRINFKNVRVKTTQGKKKMQINNVSLGSKTIMKVENEIIESNSISLVFASFVYYITRIFDKIKDYFFL